MPRALSELEWARADLWPALLLAALVLGVGLSAARARRRRGAALGEPALVARIAGRFRSGRMRLVVALQALAALLLGVALVGPVLGSVSRAVERRGIDLVVCLDASRSMLARDERPDRLTRAKREITGLLGRLAGDRVALIAFSGEAQRLAPLTSDMLALTELVETIDPDDFTLGGTDLGGALELALELFDGRSGAHEAVVLVTDGEDLEGRAAEVAERAGEAGIRVYVVGVGTREGGKIPVRDARGNEGLARDREGEEVVTRLEPETLERLARASGGEFLSTERSATPLEDLHARRIARMEGQGYAGGIERVPLDRFQWPLVAALIAWGASVALGGALARRGAVPADAPRVGFANAGAEGARAEAATGARASGTTGAAAATDDAPRDGVTSRAPAGVGAWLALPLAIGPLLQTGGVPAPERAAASEASVDGPAAEFAHDAVRAPFAAAIRAAVADARGALAGTVDDAALAPALGALTALADDPARAESDRALALLARAALHHAAWRAAGADASAAASGASGGASHGAPSGAAKGAPGATSGAPGGLPSAAPAGTALDDGAPAPADPAARAEEDLAAAIALAGPTARRALARGELGAMRVERAERERTAVLALAAAYSAHATGAQPAAGAIPPGALPPGAAPAGADAAAPQPPRRDAVLAAIGALRARYDAARAPLVDLVRERRADALAAQHLAWIARRLAELAHLADTLPPEPPPPEDQQPEDGEQGEDGEPSDSPDGEQGESGDDGEQEPSEGEPPPEDQRGEQEGDDPAAPPPDAGEEEPAESEPSEPEPGEAEAPDSPQAPPDPAGAAEEESGLSREAAQRLLDRLAEAERDARALREALARRRRVPVAKDW